MNLAAALGRAIGNHHNATATPEPQSLLGQLLDIARNTDAGRDGRPADAVGVSAATWNKWLSGARGAPGGTAPNAKSRAKIAATVKALHRDPTIPTPRRATVTADVEWNGYTNPQVHRTVALDDLNLGFMDDPEVDETDYEGLFLAAVEDRYGDPVHFTNVDTIILR